MVIKSVWMFIAIDDEGYESPIVLETTGGALPAIVTYDDRLDHLRTLVQRLVNRVRTPVQLIRVDQRVDLEIIYPEAREGSS